MIHVPINPGMLRWARERAGLALEDLETPFPKIARWEQGQEQPTLKQVEHFAKAVHVSIGFLFLSTPPMETVPIPDFRTMENGHRSHPSPDLLDTIYVCQQRQEWYHEFARSTGETPLAFVGSANLQHSIVPVAASIRQTLGFDIEERRAIPTWTEALRHFIDQADKTGILVMCSGVVFNNNRRHLDPDEFRGFAMSDDYAPLVFINGADSKAAQMFTLAHELAHIWLGQSAVSDSEVVQLPDMEVEIWCNRVAAELLVPAAIIQAEFNHNSDLGSETTRLARHFKVSTLVILRRMHDIGELATQQFSEAYKEELARIRALPKGSGGNFYLTQAARVSKRFARALVISTLEGQTLHRDAFRMLGFSKLQTFHELGRSLGVLS